MESFQLQYNWKVFIFSQLNLIKKHKDGMG
jgi:hypothetical protein